MLVETGFRKIYSDIRIYPSSGNQPIVRHQAMDTKTRQLLINPIVPENLGTASFYSISNSQYIIVRLEEPWPGMLTNLDLDTNPCADFLDSWPGSWNPRIISMAWISVLFNRIHGSDSSSISKEWKFGRNGILA